VRRRSIDQRTNTPIAPGIVHRVGNIVGNLAGNMIVATGHITVTFIHVMRRNPRRGGDDIGETITPLTGLLTLEMTIGAGSLIHTNMRQATTKMRRTHLK
jgi:hypothetical protein